MSGKYLDKSGLTYLVQRFKSLLSGAISELQNIYVKNVGNESIKGSLEIKNNSNVATSKLNQNGNIEATQKVTLKSDSSNFGSLTFASDNRTGDFIKLYGGSDSNGDGLVIGDGGVIILGSGESAINLYDALIENGSWTVGAEESIIGSDNAIRLYTDCNTIANRKETIFQTHGGIQSGVRGAGSHSWLNIMKGEAALYVPKDLTNSTTSNYAVGAVTMETAGGGAWTMANYNSEHLQFQYITPANRSSNTNTVTTVLALSPSGIVLNDTTRPYLRQQLKIDAYGSLTEMSSTWTLTTSWQKLPLSSAKFVGTGCSASSNGLKVTNAGTYMIWGSAYLGTGYTAADIVHLGIYKTTGSTATQMHDWRKRVYNGSPYEVLNAGPIVLTLAANDVIDLRAYNQTAARGTVNSLAGVGLVIKQIA